MDILKHELAPPEYASHPINVMRVPVFVDPTQADTVIIGETRPNQLWESLVLDYALETNQAVALRPLVEAEGAFIGFREIMHSLETAGVAQSPRSVTRAIEKLRSKIAFLKTEKINGSTHYALDQDALALQSETIDKRNALQVEIQAVLDSGTQEYFLKRIEMSRADEATKMRYTMYLQQLYENAGWSLPLSQTDDETRGGRSISNQLEGLLKILPQGVLNVNSTKIPYTYCYDLQVLQNLQIEDVTRLTRNIALDLETVDERFAGVRHKHKIRSVFASYVLAHLELENGVIMRQQLIDSLRQDGLSEKKHLLNSAFRELARHRLIEVHPTEKSAYGEVRLNSEFDVNAYDMYKGVAVLRKQQKEKALKDAIDAVPENYIPQIRTSKPEKEWQYGSKLYPEEQALREGLEFVVPTDEPRMLQDIFNVIRAHRGRVSFNVLGSYGFNAESIAEYLKQKQSLFRESIFIVEDDYVWLAPGVRSSRHSVVFTQN